MKCSLQFSSVTQSCPTLATLWTTARQASLSITNSWCPPKPMSIVSVMPPSHLIFCHVPLLSLIFLKRSLVFPILLLSSISLQWSLRKAFLSLLAILWNFAFKWAYLSFSPLLFASLLFTAICKASSDSHFAMWRGRIKDINSFAC